MKKHVFLLFLVGFSLRSTAQNAPLVWENWFAQLENSLKNEQFRAVVAGADSILARLPAHQKALRADAFSLKGRALRRLNQPAEALLFHQKAYQIRATFLGKRALETGRSLQNMGNCLHDLGQIDRAAACWKQNLDLILEKKGPHSLALLAPAPSLANYFFQKNDFAQALDLYKKSLTIQLDSAKNQEEKVAALQVNVANCQTKLGDYPTAILQYENAYFFYKKHATEFAEPLADCLLNLGNARLELGDYETAERDFQSARALQKNHDAARASVLNSLGLAARLRDEPTEATRFFIEAVECFPENPLDTDARRTLAGIFRNLGSALADQKDWPVAVFYFKKSLAQWQKLPHESLETARGWVKIGLAEREQNHWAAAENGFQNALRLTKNGPTSEAFAPLFQLGELRFLQKKEASATDYFQKASTALGSANGSKLIFPYENVLVFSALAQVEQAQARRSHAPSDWENVLRNARKGIVLLEKWKENLRADQSEGELQNALFSIFNAAVEASHALGRGREAFGFAGQSKSNFLKRLARRSGGRAVVVSVEQPSVEALQNGLSASQTLLEFQWADDSIYLFFIQKDTFFIEKRAAPPRFSEEIEAFAHLCCTNPESLPDREQTAAVENLARLGASIFQQLFGSIERRLTTDLVVVPDAWLCFLPFEALLKTEPTDAFLFRNYRFLAREHSVRYLFSSAQLVAKRPIFIEKKEAERRSFLAIAPVFSGKMGLAPLEFNQMEAISIKKMVGNGEAWLGAAALKSRFETAVERFQILHFSTHGVCDDRSPSASFLAFAEQKDSLENGRLRVAEIYNLKLAATDLVVLSACETAGGRLLRGEGLMSIARAFEQAGAAAVVASLWNVDDRTTPPFFERFYQFLQKNESKSAALAAAKRIYLDESAGLKGHPFFWAGFVLHGDDAAVFPAQKWAWWAEGVAAMGLAVLFWWLKWKLRHHRVFKNGRSF